MMTICPLPIVMADTLPFASEDRYESSGDFDVRQYVLNCT